MNDEICYPLQDNAQIIRKLFGVSFLRDIIDDKLNINECIAANNFLSKYLYGDEISNLLMMEDVDRIMNIVSSIKKKFNYKHSLVEDIDFYNIGMLVVRPENVGLVNEYVKFLEKRGLVLIYKKKTQISFEQYLLMYYHGLIPKESRYDFPTRTLNYIKKDCYILIFYSEFEYFIPVSDYLFLIKGKQGKHQRNTLRGDLAYNYLKYFVTVDGVQFVKGKYNLFFDPIGMCRLLVRNQICSDNSHISSDLKILFYVGQAVHVPNSREIYDDFLTLFDENDIDYVNQKIRKLKR